MAEILSTRDYHIFKKHKNNREINEPNVRKIQRSLSAINMLQFRPILVDKEMKIVDGQHRLEAAKRLGIEVYYQINAESSHEDICLLNAAQKKWTVQEYLDYYCSLGDPEYIKLKEFCSLTALGVSSAVKLCRNTGGKTFVGFYKGQFKFFSKEEENTALSLLEKMKQVVNLLSIILISSHEFIKTERFLGAVRCFLKKEEVDMDVLKNKLEQKFMSIRKCPDSSSYYAMIREIYNWRNANPVD